MLDSRWKLRSKIVRLDTMAGDLWVAEVILLLISSLPRNASNCQMILIVGICPGRIFHILLPAIQVDHQVWRTLEVIIVWMIGRMTYHVIIVAWVATEVADVKMYLSSDWGLYYPFSHEYGLSCTRTWSKGTVHTWFEVWTDVCLFTSNLFSASLFLPPFYTQCSFN